MKIKALLLIALTTGIAFGSCGDSGDQTTSNSSEILQEPGDVSGVPVEQQADPKGIGKFQNIELTNPLDQAMVDKGKQISEVKCLSCHKLTDERIGGPGWDGVTERRTPEWIMNFITNVDEMLDKDPEAQAMLEICMVRMPNQNLTDEDARAVLEFMRFNDQNKS